MIIEIVKRVNEVNVGGVVKHYSNYYINCGDLHVQIKPCFIDSANFKLLDAICLVSQNLKESEDKK